jgi:alkanesulfonate monooxygenase SsuD/methylene tetrahydromethanopterin reductase-like flavin-dependent oxidoreductase (luciferase family)
MRFGFGASNFELVPGQSLPAAHREMLEQVVLAEELGFDSVWVAEQHFSPERQCPSPFLIGTAIATRTSGVRIGVYTTMTFAHPIRVAEDAAVLDVLSGGRLILCAGTGYRKEEFAAYGVAAEGKRPRIRESLEILRLAWADEPFVYRGKYFTIPAAPANDTTGEEYPPLAVFPKPMQNPIPIWMAAFGNVGVKRAARLGYPLLPAPLESIPELQAKYQLYHATWRAVGHTAAPAAMPLMRVVYVAPQAHTAHREAEAALMPTYGRYRRWGLLTDAKDYRALARERFIIGDPVQVIEEIQGYRELLGINYLICRMAMPTGPHDHITRSMRLFSERVAPCFGHA